jgi:hypothetical protein
VRGFRELFVLERRERLLWEGAGVPVFFFLSPFFFGVLGNSCGEATDGNSFWFSVFLFHILF